MNVVLDKELARRIESAEIAALSSRLSVIAGFNDNQLGVEIKQFGNATAFSIKAIPGPSFNIVKGLTEGDEEQIERIIDFYGQKRIPVRFDLTPAHVSSDLLSFLHQKGFYQQDFHSSLYNPLSKDSEATNGHRNERIKIRELGENEFDIFAEVYTKGFGMPSFLKDGVAQNNQILYNDKKWTFYLATVEGEPAGIGVLFCENGIGSLAAAATIPSFRNSGIQTMLLKKRMQQAILQDCEFLVGQAKFGSSSQRNMERSGMRIAYTKAIWISSK